MNCYVSNYTITISDYLALTESVSFPLLNKLEVLYSALTTAIAIENIFVPSNLLLFC